MDEEISIISILLSKSCEWKYEREWRVMFSLAKVKPPRVVNGDLIHLATLDPSSIDSVIIGVRASDLLKQSIRSLKRVPEYQHLKVQTAVIDEEEYRIRIEDLQDYGILIFSLKVSFDGKQ